MTTKDDLKHEHAYLAQTLRDERKHYTPLEPRIYS
jgi:hypothetical protein